MELMDIYPRKMREKSVAIVFYLVIADLMVFPLSTPAADVMVETPQQRDARMAWWREARYGMFIHWGLYSMLGGQSKGKDCERAGEWIAVGEKIPVEEYEPLAGQFNPTKFNAKEWVSLAKEAGMKYIVITTKHHEGFCLFDSAYTTYDVMDAAPFKRDVMKELAEECQKQGIVMCWYYSIIDWHHPDYLPRLEWDTRPTAGADFNRYAAYMKNQLTELLTHYGAIGVLWFDGGWDSTWTHEMGVDLYRYLRSIQPNLIINNRIDKGAGEAKAGEKDKFAGDFGTPEGRIPATGLPGVDWESCLSLNATWGYKVKDTNWTDGPGVVLRLVKTASRGGNLLMNVGPTGEGEIPEAAARSLKEAGAWLKVNGESIYGTQASIFGALPLGFCTVKPGTIYLHIFHWPYNGKLEVPEVENKVTSVYMLADPQRTELKREVKDARWVIDLPEDVPDAPAWVAVVKVEGQPKVKGK
jgi:alpha-L-fucosidase